MLFLMCVWIRVHHKCTHQPGHSDAACSSRPALGTALSGSGPLPRQPRPRSTCPPLPQCAAPPATPRKGASGIGHCHQGELVPGTGRKAASRPRWHTELPLLFSRPQGSKGKYRAGQARPAVLMNTSSSRRWILRGGGCPTDLGPGGHRGLRQGTEERSPTLTGPSITSHPSSCWLSRMLTTSP